MTTAYEVQCRLHDVISINREVGSIAWVREKELPAIRNDESLLMAVFVYEGAGSTIEQFDIEQIVERIRKQPSYSAELNADSNEIRGKAESITYRITFRQVPDTTDFPERCLKPWPAPPVNECA